MKRFFGFAATAGSIRFGGLISAEVGFGDVAPREDVAVRAGSVVACALVDGEADIARARGRVQQVLGREGELGTGEDFGSVIEEYRKKELSRNRAEATEERRGLGFPLSLLHLQLSLSLS